MYVGASLRMFFEEEKPALLQQIDAEFEKVYLFINTPFLCYLVLLFQNKSLCKTFGIKFSLICMKMNLQENIFSLGFFRTRTHFDTGGLQAVSC